MEKKTRNSSDDLVCADFARTSPSLGNASTFSDEPMLRLANSPSVPSTSLIYVKNNLSPERPFKHRVDYKSLIEQFMQKPRSLSEEMQLRDCLIKSVTDLCKFITETTSLEGYELDLLISEKCVTDEDRVHIDADRMGPMKRTRRLLSLILLRDYRTLLVFQKSLLDNNEHVADKVLLQFDQNVRMNYRKSPKCTLCHLVNRVDMSLFIDDLLCEDDQWLMFYVKVSQADCVGPNTKLWRELINLVDAGDCYVHTSLIITKALSNCGFHSDIVKMLKEDRQLQRNSFTCRCSEMEHCRSSRDLQYSQNLQEQRSRNSNRPNDRPRGLQERSSVYVKHDGNVVRDFGVNGNHLEWAPGIVLKNGTIVGNFRIDENVNQESKKKLFSCKNKDIVSLNEVRSKMVERVHEEATAVKCLDWNRQQHHTSNDRPSDSNTHVHQMLLKTDLRKQEPKMETLKMIQLQGEKSTSNGNGGEQQTGEVFDNKMTLLKKEVVSEEEQEEATRWSDGTNCYDSLDADKHRLQEMRTDVPESENEYGRSEHEMALLKIGLPEHENNSDDGFSSCQSEQLFDNSDKEVELETITTDFIEPSHQQEKICQNRSIFLQDSRTEARVHYSYVNDSDDGFLSCRSEQFFDSSDKDVDRETITDDFKEPSSQLDTSCQNISISRHDSLTEARAHCSNTSVTSSEVVNFLIMVTFFMCFISYLVQNISAYLNDA